MRRDISGLKGAKELDRILKVMLMKKRTGTVLKIVVIVILAVLFLLAVAGAYFAIKGYKMYASAVEETPIEEKVESIRSMDNFIEFEELPEIYVDAVISVEDKRFWTHGVF